MDLQELIARRQMAQGQPGFQTAPGMQGPEYFQPGHPGTWDPNANNLWMQQHGFDRYGGITGPMGAVPADIAPGVQAAHDQSVWNAKNQLGAQASAGLQGALGLLQSFRPGGGAAIESGVYQQQAGVQLARAQMLQPLDLLGDWRRDQAHQARKAAKKAATIQMGVQLASSALGAMSGGGATPPPVEGGTAPMGAQNAQGQTMMGPGWGNPSPGTSGPGMMGGPNPTGPYQGPMSAQMGADGPSPGAGGQPMPAQIGAQGGPQGSPQQGQGGDRPSGPPGQGAPGASGGMAMGGGGVGSNGDFSPLAWASQGAARQHPAMRVAMSGYVASTLEDDPAWAAIDMAIDQQIRARVA